MKKAFASRRVPRKIGSDDDGQTDSSADSNAGDAESGLRRPTIKHKKSSNLRKSYGPSSVQDDGEDTASIVTPKRSNLSRIAVQRNAAQRASLITSERAADDEDEGHDSGPSYSAADLQALKDSTPSTPQPTSSGNEGTSQALDLGSKFGSSLARYGQSTSVPSAAEIAEKKARRARLAKEAEAEEFISLDPDDPGFDEDADGNVMKDSEGRLILKPKDKYNQAESRLVHEDEDILEGFEEFTGDSGPRIMMGASAQPLDRTARKKEISAQIAAAEGLDSDDESDASERARNDAFEAAQTRHGAYANNATSNDVHADSRRKTPPKIAPLPTLDGAISRLRIQLEQLQTSRMTKLQDMEALQREKVQIGEEEVRVQRALKETAEKFQKLRDEKGISDGTSVTAVNDSGAGTPLLHVQYPGEDSATNGAHAYEETERPRLGLGMARRGDQSPEDSSSYE